MIEKERATQKTGGAENCRLGRLTSFASLSIARTVGVGVGKSP